MHDVEVYSSPSRRLGTPPFPSCSAQIGRLSEARERSALVPSRFYHQAEDKKWQQTTTKKPKIQTHRHHQVGEDIVNFEWVHIETVSKLLD